MKEIISTISSKGQVTIPVEIRKHLGLKRGDKLAFVVDDEGQVALAVPAYSSVASLVGAAGSLETPHTWQEMRAIAREDHLEEAGYDRR